jgi:hypothetical protein
MSNLGDRLGNLTAKDLAAKKVARLRALTEVRKATEYHLLPR